MKPHMLIIGGTGMLRQVAVHFVKHGYTVSVVARDAEKLRTLVKDTRTDPGVVNMIAVNYTDQALLAAKIAEAIAILGPLTTVVSWIHSSAPEAPFTVAEVIDRQAGICRFFEILNSAAHDPGIIGDDREELFRVYPRIRYRRILLGHIVESGHIRWLTNREISDGVIAAIESDTTATVLGTISS